MNHQNSQIIYLINNSFYNLMNFGVLFDFNTLLTIILLITMSIVIHLFKTNPIVVSLIYLLLFGLILFLWESDCYTKTKLIISMIIFGLYGILTESLVISQTGVLKYNYPDNTLGLNFPLYLFFIYASWVLVISLIFKLVKQI